MNNLPVLKKKSTKKKIIVENEADETKELDDADDNNDCTDDGIY